MTEDRFLCPVNGCEKTMGNVDSLVSHVAGQAQSDDAHADMRDSDDHRRHWYRQHCVDEQQATLTEAEA